MKLAKERGHKVCGIVRPQTKYTVPEVVEIFRSSVLDHNVLEDSLEDCDSVISSLGIKRKSPSNPWAKLASPKHFATRVIKILLPLMEQKNVQRFIGISAAGVGDFFQFVHPLIRWMISNSNMQAS